MALLHRDKCRGRGGSRENQNLNVNRRSLADLMGFDESSSSQGVAAPAVSQHPNELGGEGSWRWKDSSSPEAAQTPRSLVPAGCFPPRHSTAFASYSESAQLGSVWRDEGNSGQMTSLVTSFESMKLPSRSTQSLYESVPQSISLSYDQLEKAGEHNPWPPEQAGTSSAPDNRSSYLARRASFGGATSAGRDCHGRRDENLVWNGILPSRCADPAGGFSAKVFLGGLPWDIGEQSLMQTLKSFHPVRVEWPGREGGGASPRGYAYVTFENERRVRALLAASRCDGRDWYYRITSRKMRNKEVQVIPWAVSDSNWVSGGSARLEPSRTVFVGALHGMISAAGLATIMNDLFPGVVYAGIDTDKNKYPIGSGRVTFNNVRSYVRAISAAFIEIRTAKFTKKVQVDPYLEDSMCSICKLQQGPYFCREPVCFGYFCRSCWTWSHTSHTNENHKPLMRCSKSSQYFHSYNGVPTSQSTLLPLSKMPASPAMLDLTPPTVLPIIAPHDNERNTVFNGGYFRPNEGTPSPPATNGASTNSATSGLSGTS